MELRVNYNTARHSYTLGKHANTKIGSERRKNKVEKSETSFGSWRKETYKSKTEDVLPVVTLQGTSLQARKLENRAKQDPTICMLNESSCQWPSIETNPARPPFLQRQLWRKKHSWYPGARLGPFKLGLGCTSKNGDSSSPSGARPKQVYVS